VNRPYTSGDLANEIGVSHSNAMQKVNQFVNRFRQYKNHVKHTYLTHDNGKSFNALEISKEVFEVCVAQHTIRNARKGLHKGVEEWIFGLFPNEYIIPTYEIGEEKVDFYFKDLGIVVEYDDNKHCDDREVIRERLIQEALRRECIAHGCDDLNIVNNPSHVSFPFVRIIRGKEVQGVRDLLIAMRNKTRQDVVQYME
jgi:hypothetical protein